MLVLNFFQPTKVGLGYSIAHALARRLSWILDCSPHRSVSIHHCRIASLICLTQNSLPDRKRPVNSP
jgi:hypothetical protein